MAIGTAAAIGLALTAVGTGVGAYGMIQQGAAQRRAEAARRQAMELDARRRQREAIRQQVAMQAQATAIANAQGAGESSAVSGAAGQIAGRTGVNLTGIYQNLEIGRELSAANMDAGTWGTVANIGTGMKGLGGDILRNLEPIGRVGDFLKAKWA